MRAADVYRALLWCYPAQFRHEYGGEMIGAFSEQLRDARRTSGRLAEAGVWLTTIVDILPTALREHTHVIRQDLRYAIRISPAIPDSPPSPCCRWRSASARTPRSSAC
jgi:hypothetical protein